MLCLSPVRKKNIPNIHKNKQNKNSYYSNILLYITEYLDIKPFSHFNEVCCHILEIIDTKVKL